MSRAGRLIYEGLIAAWDGFWVIWVADLLWVLFCLPIVTIPLAFAGLYECAYELARGGSITWRTFFSGIRRHWTAGLRWSLFNLVVLLLLIFYAWFFSASRGSLQDLFHSLLGGIPLALIFIWWLLNQFTFPYILVQEKPSYLNALRNSLVLFIKWPGLALGFSLFNLLILALSTLLRVPWLIFGASLPALMACLCVNYTVDQTLGARSPLKTENY